MMKKTLVSILMPAYNAEKYIAEAIESILEQTFKDFELIISDDTSSDKTWEIIKKYKQKDRRIVATRNKKNRYIAENRNLLIKSAKGKYIAWQDADDISVSNRIQKQFEFMEKNPRVGIVGGYLEFFGESGVKSIRKYAETDKELRKNIFRFSPVAQPTAMIRKKCFDELGLYNPKYPPAEDIDMSFRIGSKYFFANIPQITLRYRDHQKSATYKKLRKIELTTIDIRRKYNNKFGYHMNFIDILYNLLQLISVYLIPPKLKIFLFNKFRNK